MLGPSLHMRKKLEYPPWGVTMPLIMLAVQTYCHPTVDRHFVFGIDHIAGPTSPVGQGPCEMYDLKCTSPDLKCAKFQII